MAHEKMFPDERAEGISQDHPDSSGEPLGSDTISLDDLRQAYIIQLFEELVAEHHMLPLEASPDDILDGLRGLRRDAKTMQQAIDSDQE